MEQLYSEKVDAAGDGARHAAGFDAGPRRGPSGGRASGIAKGEAYALRRLLQKRFGPLSEDVLARLQLLSIDELELWLDRALDADSLAGVFAQ